MRERKLAHAAVSCEGVLTDVDGEDRPHDAICDNVTELLRRERRRIRTAQAEALRELRATVGVLANASGLAMNARRARLLLARIDRATRAPTTKQGRTPVKSRRGR